MRLHTRVRPGKRGLGDNHNETLVRRGLRVKTHIRGGKKPSPQVESAAQVEVSQA